MIGKIPKAGRGFKGIVSYLLTGARKPERQDGKAPSLQNATELQANARTDERANAKLNRILWTETNNLVTTDPTKAVRVMRATANRSRRCKNPVYHFVISWTPDETPSTDVMRAIVRDTCADMGLEDHQRIAIAHDDTRHKHVHVVVNRIHHETGKAWNRAQDWVRLEQSLARQAKARSLRYVPGRHNAPDDFKDQPKRSKDAELQRARRNGLPSPPMQWTASRLAAERKRIAKLFDTASSWEHLHHTLAETGLSLRQKGQGHVLHDRSGEVKLSSISKSARIALLAKRFGAPYEPPRHSPLRDLAHSRKDSSPDNVQKPAPYDVKPSPPDAYSRHPQQKPGNTAPSPPSTVDQRLSVNKHMRVETPAQHDGTSPPPHKRKQRKRRGPKL